MSQKNFMSYGDAETLFTEVGQELSDKVPKSQLTANNTDFRFGYDETTGKYGYIINEGGADTVIPFKDCDSSEVTVTAANQILSGYKDYDSNGNLITGTNAGYDAGLTQGEANMKDGVTVTAASQVLSGYKARTSDGTLVTGSDAGYSAGVTQGHSDRDSGVTVTDPYHILSGYKGRKSNGELVTGTNGGWDAGRSQGQADRDSGVTVTDPYHILSGYKGRKSNGELVTGTNGGWDAGYSSGRSQGQADRDWGVTITDASQILSGYSGRTSNGTLVNGSAQTGKQVSVAYTLGQDLKSNRIVSFSATNGAVYAIAFGGRDGVPTSMPSCSGCTALDYHYQMVDGRGYLCGLAIVQATSATVSITVFSSTKEVACVVTRVTN